MMLIDDSIYYNFTNESLLEKELTRRLLFFDSIVAKVNFSTMLVLGLIANFFCLTVFGHKKLLLKKYNYYILARTLSNFLFCAIILVNNLVYIVHPPNLIYGLSSLTCQYTDFAVELLDDFSVLMTCILAVDRLVAVARPLGLRECATHRRPKHIIGAIVLAVFVVKSPELFVRFREYVYVGDSSRTINSKFQFGKNESFNVVFCRIE